MVGGRDMRTVILDGRSLTTEAVLAVAESRALVECAPDAMERVRLARAVVEGIIDRGEVVYGINTGFGALVNTRIGPEDLGQLQVNLVRSHATAIGEPMPDIHVRAMMVVRLNSLLGGHSGVHEDPIKQLVSFLNLGITPVVPRLGSLGASGDLAPLSHVALGLIGEGMVKFDERVQPAQEALTLNGLIPCTLRAKDGLSLINGTSQMTSLLALASERLHTLLPMADAVLCMSLEARRCTIRPFSPEVHRVRPHPGQQHVAKRVMRLMHGSTNLSDHADCERVQDAYSFRCAPQVHGVTHERMCALNNVVEIELNSVTDNPLVFPDPSNPGPHEVVSQGNFHGEILGQTADNMTLALFEQASMSERRMDQMLDPARSGGRPFLARQSGLESGLMIVHYVAGAALSELHGHVMPRSAFSTVTSGGQEDHVSMGATACMNLMSAIDRFTDVLSAELLIASEAAEDLPAPMSEAMIQLHRLVRFDVPVLLSDRSTAEDLRIISEHLRSGSWWSELAGTSALMGA